MTLMALLHMKLQRVDVGVIEAGLGGLTDATNIVTSTRVAVITSIALDHEAYLGSSLESIAAHKAGIIKPGCDAVVSGNIESINIFKDQCTEVGATLHIVKPSTRPFMNTNDIRYKIADSIDQHNSDLAAQALVCFRRQLIERPFTLTEPSEKANQDGGFSERLANAPWTDDITSADDIYQSDLAVSLDGLRPDCRFELVSARSQLIGNTSFSVSSPDSTIFCLDVAHNPAAFYELGKSVAHHAISIGTPIHTHMVAGFSQGKPSADCIVSFRRGIENESLNMPKATLVSVTLTKGRNDERAQAPNEIVKGVKDSLTNDKVMFEKVAAVSNVESAMKDALLNVSRGSGGESKPLAMVLVCGSFFVMHEARLALGLPTVDADAVDMNEKKV